jgi:hypothetical protein
MPIHYTETFSQRANRKYVRPKPASPFFQQEEIDARSKDQAEPLGFNV